MLGDGDGYLVRNGIDGQCAINDDELDIREVLVDVLEVACSDADIVRACIRARHCPCSGFGCLDAGRHIVELVIGHDGLVAAHAVLCAVIGVSRTVLGDGDGHLIGNGGHGQLAGNGGDVVVIGIGIHMPFVGEGVFAPAHIRLGAGDGGIHAFILGEAAAGHGDGVVFQCLAVVHLFSGSAGQGDAALADGQAAVIHHELHVGEVGADVGKVGFLHAHGIGIRIGAGGLGRAGEGEVSDLVQIIADGYAIVGDFVGIAVIVHGLGVAGDGDNHFIGNGGDYQLAVFVGDGIVGGYVIPCLVLDDGIGDHVGHFANVGDFTGDGDAVHVIAIHIAVIAVAIGGMCCAVVDPGAVAGGDGQSLGVDGQAAVGHNKLHVGEGAVVVDEAGFREPHAVGACMGAFRIGGCALCQAEVLCGVQVGGNAVHGVAAHSVPCAVIGVGVGVAMEGHHHFRRRRGDGQLAGFLLDFVVAGLGVGIQGVGEVVLAFAHIRLAAGDIIGCAFAVSEAHAANGHFAVGQGLAVVGLAIGSTGQGHCTRKDGNEAFHGAGDDVLTGLVHRVLCHLGHNIGRACVRTGSFHGDHIGEVCFRLGAAIPSHGDFRSVIVGLGAECHDLGILIIVESDLVGAGGNGHGFGIRGYRGVAIDRDGVFRYHIIKGLTGDDLIIRHLGGGVVPHIVDGVAQVIPLDVGDGDGLILGGHGAGDHCRAGLIAVNVRRGHGISLTIGHVLGVGGCCFTAVLVNIVHGEGEDILLIVDMDNVLALIHLNGQGQVFRLIQHVAGGVLIGVGAHLTAVGGRAGCLHGCLLHTIQIILHVVGVGIGGVVEGDFLVISIQGEGLGFRLHHGVAGHGIGKLGDRGVEGLAFHYLVVSNLGGRSLLIIVNGVADVRVGCPDGVQHVFTVAVQAGFRTGFERRAAAVVLGVPADEVVAGLGGNTCGLVGQHGDLAVVQHGIGGAVAAFAAVGLVGHGHLGIGIHIHGGQGGIRVKGQVIAGVVDVAGSILPVGEHLARGGGEGAVGYTGGSIGAILVGIGNGRTRALAGGVGQGVGLANEDGLDGLALIQRLMLVNQVAVSIHPLEEGQALALNPGISILVNIGVGNGGAQCHGRRIIEFIAFHHDGDAYIQLGLLPVGVQGFVAGRHGVGSEVEGLA